MHSYAKLTVVAWASAALFISTTGRGQPASSSVTPAAAPAGAEPPSASEIRLVLESTPNPLFDVELVRSLAARLRAAGYLLTTASSPSSLPSQPRPSSSAPQTNDLDQGRIGRRRRGRLLLKGLRPSDVALGVVVEVDSHRCYVVLLDVVAQTVAVRELPRGTNDDALAEEIINVVVSAALGLRETLGTRAKPTLAAATPASAPPAAPASAGGPRDSSSVAPQRKAAKSPSPPEDVPDPSEDVSEKPAARRASAYGVDVVGGVHLQTAGRGEFSLGPRLQLALDPFAASAWFFAAAFAHHPARTISSGDGDFDVSRSFLNLGAGHTWHTAPRLWTRVSLEALAGRVARGVTNPAENVEAGPPWVAWRGGAQIAASLEARTGAGPTLGVSVALGAWARAVRFASARGAILFAEDSTFASGTVYVGYHFED